METKIQKWGNSLGIRIPSPICAELGLKRDSVVEILKKKDHIIINPVRKPKYTLSELLEGITPENLHDEVDTGSPVGNEEW